MAPTLFMAHGSPLSAVVAAGVTTYFYPVGLQTETPTETDHQVVFHSTGTLSFFLVSVYFNDLNGTSTFRTHINAANGTQTITVPAGLTGDFEDDTNVDLIADGDKVTYQLVAGGASGSMQVNILRTFYTANVDTVTRMAVTGTTTYNTASASRYNVICGAQGATETTESHTRCRQRKVGTYRNLAVNVSSNGRGTTSTVKLRKEEADTGISVSIGAGLTGFFEDTTHSTTVAVLDDMNFSTTLGTGVGDLVIRSMQIEYVNTNSTGVYVTGDSDGSAQAQGSTIYLPIMGDIASATTEGDISVRSGFVQADFLEMTIKVSQNNVDNTSSLVLRKNGVDANLSVSIPANTTGTFTDTSDTLDSSFPADLINYKVVTGAGGGGDTLTFSNTCIWAFIIPFDRNKSFTMPNPVLQDANQQFQNSFTSNFQSPMFGA